MTYSAPERIIFFGQTLHHPIDFTKPQMTLNHGLQGNTDGDGVCTINKPADVTRVGVYQQRRFGRRCSTLRLECPTNDTIEKNLSL